MNERKGYGPSLFELARRASVLLVLILRAAWLYLRMWLAGRGILDPGEERMSQKYRSFARHFVAVASRHRGALIKLGQIASLRVDVLPAEFSEELARLQDQVEPHPFEEIAAQIEGEFGRPPSALFASFEPTAIAAASLGQVHRATTHEGRDVAVKILYPGIERSVAVDVRMAGFAMWLFNFLVLPDLLAVHQQVRRTLEGEMDYVREGKAAERIAANIGLDPGLAEHVRVPEIVWQTTSRRVLTMEFIDGDKVNDLAALAERGVDIEDVIAWAVRVFLHMMLRDGFFHCDPHPGNLFVDREGRLAIVDFGMNQEMSQRVLDAIRRNVMATVARNAAEYAQSMLDLGAIEERDRRAVEALAEVSFDPQYYNLTPSELAKLDFALYFKRVREQLRGIRSLRLPDGVVMWGRALSILYGLVSELAPGIRPLDLVGPYVLGFLQVLPPPPARPAAG